MSKIEIQSKQEFVLQSVHENGATLMTDAPPELGGGGKHFSPTDLLTTALATCAITLMELKAKKLGLHLGNITASIEKEMSKTPPRKIVQLTLEITIDFTPTPEQKQALEEAALTCPVHHSLHPETQQNIRFNWKAQ